MMTNKIPLAQKKCQPCEGIGSSLNRPQAEELLKDLPGWNIDQEAKTIWREYTTKNFIAAVQFVQKIASVAEANGHHPDIHLTGYRNLKIDLSTHALGGLSENDFIVAAQINELPVELKQ